MKLITISNGAPQSFGLFDSNSTHPVWSIMMRPLKSCSSRQNNGQQTQLDKKNAPKCRGGVPILQTLEISFLFHPRSIFVSISLLVYYWQFPYFHRKEWIIPHDCFGKKCFWTRGVSNPQPLVPIIELKRRALAISTVGSLNKSCGLKVPYKELND
jgi:hypothetical protein